MAFVHATAGVRAELVLGAAQRGASATAAPPNNAFLQQRLSYDGEKLLDEGDRGVMMAWEGPWIGTNLIACGNQSPFGLKGPHCQLSDEGGRGAVMT